MKKGPRSKVAAAPSASRGGGSCEVTLPQAEEASKPVLKAKTKQPEALWSLEGLAHLAHPFCGCEVLAAHSFPKVVYAFSLP